MLYGSLFAGIKGDRGFDDAGWECRWAVEIEPFCQSVIRTHYPGLPVFSDIRDCGAHNLAPVDLITAGFPCQDLSVAGKRGGLDGHRSSLFWEACRIAAELRPAWLVCENVPGLFSSRGGKDFAAILRGLGDLGCFQSIAWRVLDSRWFGVAQRRRRVFLVASARAGGAEEVLFESESGPGNLAPSAQAWQNLAGPLGGGAYGTGRRDEDDPNLAIAAPLNTQNGHCINAEDAAGNHIVAAAIAASNGHHGHSSPRGDGSDNLVAHAVSCSSVSSGYRYDPNGEDYVVATINRGGNSGGFRTEPGEHSVAAFINPRQLRNSESSNQVGIKIDASCTDALCSDGPGAVAFAENQRGELRTSSISPQLSCAGGKPGSGYPAVAFTERTRDEGRTLESQQELAYAFTNPGSGGRTHSRQVMTPAMCVRRLTPCECECLQGFPKGWTIPGGVQHGDYLPDGLDSARYRALGNAWTVQVGRWIAERILRCTHKQSSR